ncbi:hypothetical protein U0070_023593 [Myodes glareolus]|uniref:Uncharacterized protein n=1 Tax=Myodes glareolus TaxID=447135 RepID=A0AAW0HNG0_MYOGA
MTGLLKEVFHPGTMTTPAFLPAPTKAIYSHVQSAMACPIDSSTPLGHAKLEAFAYHSLVAELVAFPKCLDFDDFDDGGNGDAFAALSQNRQRGLTTNVTAPRRTGRLMDTLISLWLKLWSRILHMEPKVDENKDIKVKTPEEFGSVGVAPKRSYDIWRNRLSLGGLVSSSICKATGISTRNTESRDFVVKGEVNSRPPAASIMRLLVRDCIAHKRKKSDGKGEESDEVRKKSDVLRGDPPLNCQSTWVPHGACPPMVDAAEFESIAQCPQELPQMMAAAADGLGSIALDTTQLNMSVTDPTAWATAMNNLGMVPVGLPGQQLVSGKLSPGFKDAARYCQTRWVTGVPW